MKKNILKSQIILWLAVLLLLLLTNSCEKAEGPVLRNLPKGLPLELPISIELIGDTTGYKFLYKFKDENGKPKNITSEELGEQEAINALGGLIMRMNAQAFSYVLNSVSGRFTRYEEIYKSLTGKTKVQEWSEACKSQVAGVYEITGIKEAPISIELKENFEVWRAGEKVGGWEARLPNGVFIVVSIPVDIGKSFNFHLMAEGTYLSGSLGERLDRIN